MNLTPLILSHLEQFSRLPLKLTNEPPRPNTLNAHRLHLERFAEYCKSSELTVNLCINFVSAIIQRKLSQSNINQCLTALNSFLHWLHQDNKFSFDQLSAWNNFHSAQYRPVKKTSSTIRKFLRDDELEKVMTAIYNTPNTNQRNRDLSIASLILFGAGRPGEIIQLKYEHIVHIANSEHGPHYKITIPANIAKDHAERDICIFADSRVGNIDIYDHFTQYRIWRNKYGSEIEYFLTVKGLIAHEFTPKNWHKCFATAMRRSGLNITSYWLKHTFGEITSPHLDKRDLRQLLGHSRDETTEVYTDHKNPERLLQAQRNASLVISNYSLSTVE